MYLERRTHKVIGKYEDLAVMEKKFDALEAKMANVPSKRRYFAVFGTLPLFEFVWEREWTTLAAMEAYYDITMNDPEWNAASEEASKIVGEGHSELYASFE